MIEVRMPKAGEAITEGVVVEMVIPDGGSVQEGELLYVLGTDKVDMDMPSPASGVVRWKVELGQPYNVGELLAVIE